MFKIGLSSPQLTWTWLVVEPYPSEKYEFVSWDECSQYIYIYGSLNVPIEHHPTIRYMVYNGYYKVMSNIPKMGQLPTPDIWTNENVPNHQPGTHTDRVWPCQELGIGRFFEHTIQVLHPVKGGDILSFLRSFPGTFPQITWKSLPSGNLIQLWNITCLTSKSSTHGQCAIANC